MDGQRPLVCYAADLQQQFLTLSFALFGWRHSYEPEMYERSSWVEALHVAFPSQDTEHFAQADGGKCQVQVFQSITYNMVPAARVEQ